MKRVLACLDESPQQSVVLAYLRAQLTREPMDLTLLHVVNSAEVLTLPGVAPGAAAQEALDAAKRTLHEIAAQLPSDAPASRVLVDVGEPWRVICRLANELGVSLIVIGTHGARGMEHVFGTTTTAVVQRAPCSVLVVRRS
jgi:nucleotide-binding universal stress UspA family protein